MLAKVPPEHARFSLSRPFFLSSALLSALTTYFLSCFSFSRPFPFPSLSSLFAGPLSPIPLSAFFLLLDFPGRPGAESCPFKPCPTQRIPGNIVEKSERKQCWRELFLDKHSFKFGIHNLVCSLSDSGGGSQTRAVFRITQGFVKTQNACPTPRVCDSVGLRWGLRTCISNRFPGDAIRAGPEAIL